jgi:hypothetical protein
MQPDIALVDIVTKIPLSVHVELLEVENAGLSNH